MERVVEDFILYLHETKNTSKNTEVSYERDLKKLIRYLQEQNLTGFSEVTCTDLQGYLNKIKSENLAASTISRNIASIRALYHYLIKTGIVSEDPTEALLTSISRWAMWYAMTAIRNVSSRSEMSAGMQFCNIWSIPEAFLQKIQKRVHCLRTARGNP